MKKYLASALLILSLILIGTVHQAHAVLQRVGPNSPDPAVGNFPSWYQDNTGITLEFCDPKNDAELDGGWCLLTRDAPGVPGVLSVPEVFPTNFFDEHFWFAADASMTHAGTPNGANRVLLVLAVEAAFFADVTPGGQIAFSRIRIRMDDVPVTGEYRFIHPYGEELIDGVAGDRIFFTDDTGINCPPGQFDCALQSRLGPFLLPSLTPGGAELPAITGPVPGKLYIADPARIGPVTGSPLGQNLFRVEGPQGSNLGGPGIDFIETTDFTLMGRIFSNDNAASVIPGQVTVDRASYTRNSTRQKVDVFATAFESTPGRLPADPVPAPILPQLSFFDAPCTPSGLDNNLDPIPPFSAPVGATETQMDNAGNISWGQILLEAIPAGVCIKDNVTNTYFPKSVVDEITITEAFFDPNAQSLSVKARSSDTIAPPTLTLGGFGDLASGEILVPSLAAAPATVRVLSTAGGVNEYQVTSTPPPPPPPPPPATAVSLFPFPSSPQLPGTQVSFIAGASGGSGLYEYQFWHHDGTSWSMVKDYSEDGNIWNWDTTGLSFGTYMVTVYVRSAGSTSLAEAIFGPLSYIVTVPVTGVTLTPSPASPATVGDNVVFTAAASGGSGTYEYQFWHFNGTSWSMVKDYSVPGDSWTWDTAGLTAGTYQVTVYARSAGSPSLAEATFGPLPYDLQ